MYSLNRATILGNLTRDPELRQIPSGQNVASFGVATNRRWTDQNGQPQEATDFHDIVAWGKLAEISQQILRKGSKVYIEGRIQTRSWEGQDGVKRYRTEIVAENFISLTPKGMGMSVGESAPSESANYETQKQTPSVKQTPSETIKDSSSESVDSVDKEAEIDLNDMPF